jgi:BMFP domain-containing protein YqiC
MPGGKPRGSQGAAGGGDETSRDTSVTDRSSRAMTEAIAGSIDHTTLDKLDVILSRVTSSLIDSFNSSIQQLVRAFTDNTQQKLDFQAREIFELNTRIDGLTTQMDGLRNENITLKASTTALELKLEQLAKQVDENDQHARLENLILQGIPADTAPQTENLYEKVPQLLNSLFPELRLTSSDISIVHRLPSSTAQATSTRPRPPPVIIRFTRKATRNYLLQHRKLLKGKSVAVSEHLTPTRSALLKQASVMVTQGRLSGAWTKDGKVLVKSTANRIFPVSSTQELNQVV